LWHLNLHLVLDLESLTNIGIDFCLRMWKQLSTILVGSMDLLRVIIFCYCIFLIYCFVSISDTYCFVWMYAEDGEEDINFQNVLDEGSSKVASNVINMEEEAWFPNLVAYFVNHVYFVNYELWICWLNLRTMRFDLVVFCLRILLLWFGMTWLYFIYVDKELCFVNYVYFVFIWN